MKAVRLVLAAVLALLMVGAAPASAEGPADRGAYGNPWAADNLANLEIGSKKNRQVDYRFVADASGSVSAVRLFWIWSKPDREPVNDNNSSTLCNGWYSCGDGGDIEVTLRPDNGAGQPSSTVLARGVDFTPMGSPSFYHTIAFSSAAAVSAGTKYHIVMRNVRSSGTVNNYVSVDSLQSAGAPRQPLFSDTDFGVRYKDGSGSWTPTSHTPIFTLTHTDGSKHGPGAPYVNARSSSAARTVSGASRVAQMMIPKTPVTATGAAFRLRYSTGTGSVTLRLKNAAGSDVRSCSARTTGTTWVRCSFASSTTLAAGATYRLVASAPSGTSYRTWPLTEGPGFASPWQFTDGHAQYTTDNGVSWLTPSITDDWQAYLTTTSTPTPEPTPTPTPEPTPTPTPTPEPTPTPTPTPTPDPDPTIPALGQPSCTAGATSTASGTAIRSAIQAGQDACVTTSVGNIDLSNLNPSTNRTVGTTGAGSIGTIRIGDASNLTIQARFRSTLITLSHHITIQQSRIGGESGARILDQLVFVREPSDNVTIRDNDIGWTTSDDSGNTGFGLRIYNDSDNLTVQRNYIHHIGADAMQISIEGDNALIDRNEIAYAARPSGGNEHSDDLQMAGQGPNNRVTNNWFHHCGWWSASGPTTGCNGSAIHAGSSNAFLYENNLESDALGIHYVGDLGTGGCSRSNTTYRRNTFYNMATQFGTTQADLRWGLCGGSNNLLERNVVVNNLGNPYGFAASGTTARDNVVGNYTLDANGNCQEAACNPAGAEPIGYRKPSGVHW